MTSTTFDTAIILPTYTGHFCFIPPFLESAVSFMQDRQETPFFFIVNKSETPEFLQLVAPYASSLLIKTIETEEILKDICELSPDAYLKKFGKFAYQTMKKLAAAKSIEAKQFVILDSESIFFKKTNINELAHHVVDKKTIYASRFSLRKKCAPFLLDVHRNTEYLIGEKSDCLFLENPTWVFEKHILDDLWNDIGNPYRLALDTFINPQTNTTDLFEGFLYFQFIAHRIERYGYKIRFSEEMLEQSLSKDNLQNYYANFYRNLNGHAGLLEFVCTFVNKDNWSELGSMIQKENIPILRCEQTINYAWQKKFLDAASPNLLGASQDHMYGTKASRLKVTTFILKGYTIVAVRLLIRNLPKKVITLVLKILNLCISKGTQLRDYMSTLV